MLLYSAYVCEKAVRKTFVANRCSLWTAPPPPPRKHHYSYRMNDKRTEDPGARNEEEETPLRLYSLLSRRSRPEPIVQPHGFRNCPPILKETYHNCGTVDPRRWSSKTNSHCPPFGASPRWWTRIDCNCYNRMIGISLVAQEDRHPRVALTCRDAARPLPTW